MEITAGEKGSLKAELTNVSEPIDQTEEVQLKRSEALLNLLDPFKVFPHLNTLVNQGKFNRKQVVVAATKDLHSPTYVTEMGTIF